MTTDSRYAFGRNWGKYVRKHLSEERIQAAQNKLLSFSGLQSLEGMKFLDVGCGSGLHSLAAWRAAASSVTSFDYDQDSVAATRRLMAYAGEPNNWTVRQGSVLDSNFVDSLSTHDFVYSWGVLHHTGAIWQALDQTLRCVKPDGFLYLALYAADVQVDPPPEYWLDLKQRYNAANAITRQVMELQYIWRFGMQGKARNIRYEVRKVFSKGRGRGMEYMTDIRDWLGGWPMEFVWDREVITKCESTGFSLINLDTGQACSEYLFKRDGEISPAV